MTSEQPQAELYGVAAGLGRLALQVPLRTRTRVVRIVGKGRVEAVEIEHLGSGEREVIACDTVIFTGDWIPDNELARAAGLPVDAGTRGPLVDTELATDRRGIFAAGNLLHPVDTADIAALDGAHVAQSVLDHLAGRTRSDRTSRIIAEPPLRWISPMVYRYGGRGPARKRLLAWVDRYVAFPRVVVSQNGRTVAARRLPWPAAPGRVFRIPSSLLSAARPGEGDLTISVHDK